MKHKTAIFGVLVLLMIAYVQMGTADVLAQTGGPYDLSWSTTDGGSQSSTGGSYWLGGTAGQLEAGSTLVGGAFELTGGFWSFQEGNPTAVTLASFTATPQGSGVLVQWEMAIEIDNVGFNLYRAQAPEGDWTCLNATLIPSQAPGSVVGATYTWFDEDVEAGATYYYKLEDVEVAGRRTLHGPISAQPGGPTSITLRVLGIEGWFGYSLLAVGAVTCLSGAVLWWRTRRR
jgi:hypothetical protein